MNRQSFTLLIDTQRQQKRIRDYVSVFARVFVSLLYIFQHFDFLIAVTIDRSLQEKINLISSC